jgi:hypothetical protein
MDISLNKLRSGFKQGRYNDKNTLFIFMFLVKEGVYGNERGEYIEGTRNKNFHTPEFF